MDTSAFFARKRQEQQQQNPSRKLSNDTKPWWQDTNYTQPEISEKVNDSATSPSHPSRSIRNDGNCPNCNSGSFVKPSSTSAARCFDCGFIEGRQVNDLDTLNIMSPSADARVLHVRQTADGGAHKYRARISRNAAE